MKKSSLLLTLGILFISFNLRAPITAVGSVIDFIKEDLELSSSMAGFITTLPLIVFAAVSPFVCKISDRLGNGKTIFIGLITVLIGELIRSYTNSLGLFLGTSLIGAGIAIGNVLIPSIIKLKFSKQVGIMTSLYITGMTVFAAIGSGISVPLSQGLNLGWRNALASWGVLVVLTILIWLPELRSEDAFSCETEDLIQSDTSIWKSKLAWWVTLFMGTQSLLFYCLVTWLPSIVLSKGISAETSGYITLFFQLIGLPATLVMPLLADKFKEQRIISTVSSSFYLIGMILLLSTKNLDIILLATAFLGLGMGGSISLSISFISLRTPNSKKTAELSGMSQSAGYLLAAVGPTLIGFIFDKTNSWTLPIGIFIIAIILLILIGLKAGADEVTDL